MSKARCTEEVCGQKSDNTVSKLADLLRRAGNVAVLYPRELPFSCHSLLRQSVTENLVIMYSLGQHLKF